MDQKISLLALPDKVKVGWREVAAQKTMHHAPLERVVKAGIVVTLKARELIQFTGIDIQAALPVLCADGQGGKGEGVPRTAKTKNAAVPQDHVAESAIMSPHHHILDHAKLFTR
jgi:hypothetical protein